MMNQLSDRRVGLDREVVIMNRGYLLMGDNMCK